MNSNQIASGTIAVVAFMLVFGWAMMRWRKRSDDSAGWLIGKLAITALVVPVIVFIVPMVGPLGIFAVLLCSVVLIILWTGNLCSLIAKPFMDVLDGGDAPPPPRPFYSAAITKQKLGKYREAIADVRQQLKNFPADFEGHLLLAKIQAENLNDLPGAEVTLHRFCKLPGKASRQITAALSQLADWHLHLHQDREAARERLEEIIELFPDSEMALQAAQRIAHLADTRSLLAPHDRQKISMTDGLAYPGLGSDPCYQKSDDATREQLAAEYVKRLEEHPLDGEAREKLALLYAEHYKRLDLAISELEQLIQLPNQPARQVVRWLNLLADLQIQHGADLIAARQTLQRIIDQYPDAVAAENARRRLDHIKLGLKRTEKGRSVKLGSYDQDIGLKGGA